MKQVNFRYLSLVILIGIFSSSILGNSQLAFTCPDKFVAKVTSVNDVLSAGFQKEEINFQVMQKIKGTAFDTKQIQIVKGGVVEFVVGQTYTVQTRENWLCDASVVSSN